MGSTALEGFDGLWTILENSGSGKISGVSKRSGELCRALAKFGELWKIEQLVKALESSGEVWRAL
eukprot:8916631-Alexandrium_andersonii.AAC.1